MRRGCVVFGESIRAVFFWLLYGKNDFVNSNVG